MHQHSIYLCFACIAHHVCGNGFFPHSEFRIPTSEFIFFPLNPEPCPLGVLAPHLHPPRINSGIQQAGLSAG